MTTFEQKAGLNHFVDPSIPLSWSYRWARLRLVLPLLVFITAFLWEMILFGAWLSDWPVFSMIAVCAVVAFIPFALVFFFFEFGVRRAQRSKREIELRDRGALIPVRLLRWEQIKIWQFEPIPDFPEYSKLTIEYTTQRKPKRRRFWQMVLEKPTQVQELISELESQKQRRPMNYEVKVLDKASPPRRTGIVSNAGVWQSIAGYYLFIHGGPMLVKGLEGRHDQSGQDAQLTPERAAKLARFVHAHFANAKELQHFFITVGGTLTIMAIVLMIWGGLLKRRARRQFGLEQGR